MLDVLGHDGVVAGQEVAPLVPDPRQRAPAEREAPDDLIGTSGHIVVRRGDVGVLAIGREPRGGRVEVWTIEVVPKRLDQGAVLFGLAHGRTITQLVALRVP